MIREDSSSDWYHGKLSRSDAENILLEESHISNSDGIFLVRESTTSENSYVLSVYFDTQFFHYQIQQHGEDSFFSIDGQQPIHGLECLVEFYRNNVTNLCTKLKNFVKKKPPPISVRRHGNSNLLHRATKKNQMTVVKEMLKTTYRNLDAKDEHGMTAVHLACKHQVNPEILKLLIDRGAAVSSRDSSGNTPLHYACEYQSKEMVELLVNSNKNLIQARNSETGAVSLHYAAKAGNLDIIKFLLLKRAPPMPRTSAGLFPADLAQRESGVAEYLSEYKAPISTLSNKWNHGTLDRKEAFRMLLEKREELYEKLKEDFPNGEENPYVNLNKEKDDLISGLFLVRLSEKNNGYVITMLHNDVIKNYKIEKDGKYLYIDDGPYMLSLENLISHYMEFADGLPVALRHPVEPKPRPPVPLVPPIKRKSIEMSPSKRTMSPSLPLASPGTSEHMNNNSINESPKSSWMNSLPSVFSRKKKQNRSMSKDEKSMPDISPVINSFKSLSFSTDMLSMAASENYDIPPPAPKKMSPQETADYFTKSDKNVFLEADNCIEEIYFVDPPDVEKPEWNQLDPELYDTRKNLMKEMNQNTGANYYVSKSDLVVEHEIGSGEFGAVLRGVLRYKNGNKIFVAIKTLHKEHYEENLSQFLREASVMIKLDNEYIVKLIGITKGPPIGLVQELLPLGSLATYLDSNAEEIDVKDMHLWASQIAIGMEYLESKRFVHRDLAARNILLATKIHCKISDFGLSRALGIDKDFYQSNGGRWPLKWYAPENFFGTFSTASDVWSFGITLWEIYSKGQQPYGDLTGSEVNDLIEQGQRLSMPEFCPDDIYKIMTDCWQHRDRMRPNFQFLARFFSNLLKVPEGINEEVAVVAAAATIEDTENEENEKQHSNTVYV